ncbi:MAG: co-chaperone YbbN [Proteobacteria bacterium]|nr:co-chaperone YbbN [Pseudomonadota bacterium]
MFAQKAKKTVKDTTLATFVKDVIETSMTTLVIVDFWAPWCEPCQQLTPLLEKVIEIYQGKAQLVKVNADENPEICMQLRVQSLPTVYLFSKGKPIDGFMGLVSEAHIKALLQKHLGSSTLPDENFLKKAQEELDKNNVELALSYFYQVLNQEPTQKEALAGVIRCLLLLGRTEEAKAMLNQIPEKDLQTFKGLSTYLNLLEKSRHLNLQDDLEQAFKNHQLDPQVRYDLALVFFKKGRYNEAIEALLDIIKKDPNWNNELARKTLLDIFDVLGFTHPLTIKGRRQLSAVLFV